MTAFLAGLLVAAVTAAVVTLPALARINRDKRRAMTRHPSNWVEPGVYEVRCADCDAVVWHMPTDGVDLLIVARQSAHEWEPVLHAHLDVCVGRKVA